MVLPQAVIRAAVRGPVLVELKNGDSYSGTLVAVDNLMNIRLQDAICTPKSEHCFQRLTECAIRGQFVKLVRFADGLLDTVAREAGSALQGKARGKGSKFGKGGREAVPTERIGVPAPLVGALIGKGGETIKRISTESGARIEVAKEADASSEGDERSIYISGPHECIASAKALIQALVRERTVAQEHLRQHKSQGQSRKDGGRGGGGRGNRRQGGGGGKGQGGSGPAAASVPVTTRLFGGSG